MSTSTSNACPGTRLLAKFPWPSPWQQTPQHWQLFIHHTASTLNALLRHTHLLTNSEVPQGLLCIWLPDLAIMPKLTAYCTVIDCFQNPANAPAGRGCTPIGARRSCSSRHGCGHRPTTQCPAANHGRLAATAPQSMCAQCFHHRDTYLQVYCYSTRPGHTQTTSAP